MGLFNSDAPDPATNLIGLSLEEAERSHARAVRAAWVVVIVVTASAALLMGGPALLRARSIPQREAARTASSVASAATRTGRAAALEAPPQAAPDEAGSARITQIPALGSTGGATVSTDPTRTKNAGRQHPGPVTLQKPVPSTPRKAPAVAERQRLDIAIGEAGYEPSTLSARATIPITLVVEKGEGCAAGFLMPALGVSADNSRGPVSIDIGILKEGTYTFTCGMGMVEGRLIVRS